MKAHFLPLLLIFSFLSNGASGQYIPMVEEGKFWIYLNHFDSDHPVPVTGHAITLQGDTIVNFMNYKKAYKYNLKGYHNCQFPPCFQFDLPYQASDKYLVSLIREDTIQKKVYNLPLLSLEAFCDATEYLLFDFSLDIGDTLNECIYEFIGASNDLPHSGIVDSIRLTAAFGKLRNAIYTYGYPSWGYLPVHDKVLLMEGVGLENYGIFHEPLSYLVDICEGGMEQCQIILSNTTIAKNQDVSVFPNPTTGVCQVSLGEEVVKRITVYSATGVYITEVFNTNQVDLSPLESGFYFLEIIAQSGGRIVEKVVKEN
ncbi:MAG: T9SS type A sorting domain-containing protein [Saprospiraceae bacterium]|nr:T9SS type A sorting domain-containing protein [Candidatus Opimibacter iunctus]